MIRVTAHACERYLERVDGGISFDQARATIAGSARAVAIAALLGCGTVRLGNGARLILSGETVVTVLEPIRRRRRRRREFEL